MSNGLDSYCSVWDWPVRSQRQSAPGSRADPSSQTFDWGVNAGTLHWRFVPSKWPAEFRARAKEARSEKPRKVRAL